MYGYRYTSSLHTLQAFFNVEVDAFPQYIEADDLP